MNAFILIYRNILAPLLMLIYLIFILPTSKKQRQLFSLRRQKRSKKPHANQDCYWFHASSGEFEYAKPLIRKFREENPGAFLLATYSSPSYAQQIYNFPDIDESLPLPFDLVGPIQSFLKTYQPKCLLVTRGDLWPELLHQCKRRKIPALLFATSFHQKQSFFAKLWKRLNLKLISKIYLTREEDTQLLKSWGIQSNRMTVGDPRFDEVIRRNKLNNNETYFTNNRPVLLAGSTWPEDEKVILDSIIEKIKQKSLNLIIAPHEVDNEHLNSLISQFERHNINYTLHSKLNKNSVETPVLILDKVGFLADMYKIAHFSFIGGSFKKRVHSVMESLSEGKPVILGPFYKNNLEAIVFSDIDIEGYKAINIVNSNHEFSRALDKMLLNANSLNKAIWRRVQKHSGATTRIYNDLKEQSFI